MFQKIDLLKRIDYFPESIFLIEIWQSHSLDEVLESAVASVAGSGAHGSHQLLHGRLGLCAVHLPVAGDVGLGDVGLSSVLGIVDGVFHLPPAGLGLALGMLLVRVLGLVFVVVQVETSWLLRLLVDASFVVAEVGWTRH